MPAELAAFEATELGRRYPSTSKAFRDARGAVHALPRVPARTAARDLYDQLDRVAQPPAAEDHPGTAATSQTITRSSSCSGWRSATSKTNERATGRKSEVCAPSNAKHPDASSRARSRRTGNRHCNSSHWSTPTASTPTSDHHDRERLHKELDRLRRCRAFSKPRDGTSEQDKREQKRVGSEYFRSWKQAIA